MDVCSPWVLASWPLCLSSANSLAKEKELSCRLVLIGDPGGTGPYPRGKSEPSGSEGPSRPSIRVFRTLLRRRRSHSEGKRAEEGRGKLCVVGQRAIKTTSSDTQQPFLLASPGSFLFCL